MGAMAPRKGLIVVKPFGGTATAYAGFDGAVWPEEESANVVIDDGLASIDQLREVRRYAARVQGAAIRYLVVGSDSGELSESSFLGIDLGWYESQWSHFSVNFHEIAFGRYEALASFRTSLNSAGLFADSSRIAGYIEKRNALKQKRADLEELTMATRDPYGVRVYAIGQ